MSFTIRHTQPISFSFGCVIIFLCYRVPVARSKGVFFGVAFCRSLFVLLSFSFGPFVVCPSSIYGFWLHLCYLQTFSIKIKYQTITKTHSFVVSMLYFFLILITYPLINLVTYYAWKTQILNGMDKILDVYCPFLYNMSAMSWLSVSLAAVNEYLNCCSVIYITPLQCQ
jgi:hypothetical protein